MKFFKFKYSKRYKFNLQNNPKLIHNIICSGQQASWNFNLFSFFSFTNDLLNVKNSFSFLFKHIKITKIFLNIKNKRIWDVYFNTSFDFFLLLPNWFCRIDTCLVFSRFCVSSLEAKKFIKENRVFVNGVPVVSFHYILKPGDLVELKSDLNTISSSSFRSCYKKSHVFFTFPSFLEISFSSNSFVFCYKPSFQEIMSCNYFFHRYSWK